MSSVKKYDFAVIATDVAIFTIRNKKPHVLLIKMKKHPYEKAWAAPGGLVHAEESVDDAAKRHLKDKTGVHGVYLEQLGAFGEPNRDPFGRVVSVAYFALVPGSGFELTTTDEYEGVMWFPLSSLPELAYDHRKIIQAAFVRLRAKLEYTNIAYSLLPKEFSLTELQQLYEIILGRTLDKRNFRKKFLALGLVSPAKGKTATGAHRPAQLYAFKERKPMNIEVI